MSDIILFASDLHLTDADPLTTEAFYDFLRGPAQQASALYLLGDLFEYWAGDDDDDPYTQQVAGQLKALADGGTALFLMHGNRDFLLGTRFAEAAGAILLADPHPLEAFNQRLLLSHGDALCTDDLAYQQFRATVRQPAWQAAFLACPLAQRREEISRVRAASEAAKRTKEMEIMDVNARAVDALLVQWPGFHLLHGHTHRPARHLHEVQHSARQRWVLPDWHSGCGGYLALDEAGLRFIGICQPGDWAKAQT